MSGRCQRCGAQTTRDRLCAACARDERYGSFSHATSQNSPEKLRYECCECGSTYVSAGLDSCPDCGVTRARVIEEVDDESEIDRGRGTVPDGGRTEPTKHEEWSLLKVEWDCITRRARARFMDQWDDREDWKQHEARWHVYKAQDQLSVASYHARQDDADELVKTNIADAVNHMLMAMATLGVDHDGCQPILDEDDLLFAGGGMDG